MTYLLLLVTLSLGAPAFAATPDAKAIVQHMKDALEPPRASTRTITIVVSDKEGEAAQWIAGQAQKKIGHTNRMLTTLLSPGDVRGVAFLVKEDRTEPDRQWVYLPVVRRAREIVPFESQHSFLNTDFTYADLGFVDGAQTYKLIGTEARDGKKTYRLESRPGERWYSSRTVTWVAADSWLPVRREIYDPSGALWKVETWAQVTEIDGVPLPLRITMDDVRQGSRTELRVSDVLWDRDIPDDMFEPQHLPDTASAAIWSPSPEIRHSQRDPAGGPGT